MKKHLWVGALAALSVTMGASIAGASSHREAPAISNDPAADNTDVYAFVTGDKLNIVCSWIPFEEPSGGPNYYKFSDEVLYEIHVARGPTSLDDAITYQIRFHNTPVTFNDPGTPKDTPAGGQEFFAQLTEYFNQTYSVTKISGGTATEIVKDAKVAPPNIGPNTNAFGVAYPGKGKTYDAAFMGTFVTSAGGEGRTWAGQSDDAFFVDIGGIFDLANLRPAPGHDNLAHFNVHTIALEIPMTQLTASGGPPSGDADILGIWASSSRRKVRVLRANGQTQGLGPWTQVSRLGFPLVNEALIGIQDKDKYNRTKPKDDLTNFGPYILSPVLVRDAEFEGLYKPGGPLAAVPLASVKTGRFDIVNTLNLGKTTISSIGDVLRVDMSSATPAGFPNGRALDVDVTDVELSLILTKTTSGVGDGVNGNDAPLQPAFPYVAVPWEGFTNGHSMAGP